MKPTAKKKAPAKRKSRRVDPDISALKACARALNKCTSRRTVAATLEFLTDYYLRHPSKELPAHLQPHA